MIRTGGIHHEALETSLEVREKLGIDFRSPLPVFDVCQDMGLTVRFVSSISMEGIYVPSGLIRPTIILSSLRPQARRAFTCAHELAHHLFNDGLTLDQILKDERRASRTPQERRADSFAGHLLMPTLGIARAFSARGWDYTNASPEQYFVVACEFGVGYTTLITHMETAMRLLPTSHAERLRKIPLSRIRRNFLGYDTGRPLIVTDQRLNCATIDAEVGTLLLLPSGAVAGSAGLEPLDAGPSGSVFKLLRQGIYRATVPGCEWSILIRVSRKDYHGLARYRHLESEEDDD